MKSKIYLQKIKGIVLFVFFLVLIHSSSLGQSITVADGSPCVGQQMIYLLAPDCYNVTWSVNGDYVLLGQDSHTITLKWNQPGTWSVGASYTDHFGNPGSTSTSTTVYTNTTPTFSITYSPVAPNCYPTPVTFSVAQSFNGGPLPTYAWYVDDSPVSSGNSTSYIAPSLSPGTHAVYAKMTSNAPCNTSTVTSNTVSVTITQTKTLNLLLVGDSTICSTYAPSYYVVPPISGSVTYAWTKSGSTVGSNSYSYTAAQGEVQNGNIIACKVHLNESCVSNNDLTLSKKITVNPSILPSLSITPNKFSFCQGDEVTFSASANGTLSEYQWSLTGLGDSQAGTGSSFTTTNFKQGNLVSLMAKVTGSGCVNSGTVTATTNNLVLPITVYSLPNPPGVIQPYIIPYNTSGTLSATGAAGNESYKWYNSNNQLLSGTTTGNLTSNTSYYVTKYSIVTSCESKPGTPFTVTVDRLPIANAGPDQTIALAWYVNIFTINGSGSDPDGTVSAYAWTQLSGPSATLVNDKTASLTIAYSTVGTYVFRLTVTDDQGLSASDDVTINVVYPSNNYNYIKTSLIQVQNVTTMSQVNSLTVNDKSVNMSYIDGLGRNTQQVNWQASPSKQDIVQPKAFDQFSRETNKYLPYTGGSDGSFKTDALTSQPVFYTQLGYQPYDSANARTVFENSPLNRVLQQGNPGKDWQPSAGHVSGFGFFSNLANEVKQWNIVNDTVCQQNGYYPVGQLSVTVTTDENQNKSKEYKDNQGHTVLKKSYNGTDSLQTYYAYDDMGLLRYVLPPQAVAGLSLTSLNPSTSIVKQYCFYYQYDKRQRMVIKQIPGAAPVYMIYDNRDRAILTQDGTLRYNNDGSARNQWMFTKYDILNRPLLNGLYTDARKYTLIQADVNAFTGINLYEEPGAGAHGYTIRTFPKTGITDYLTVNYYDNYPEFDPVQFKFYDAAKIDTYTGDNGSKYFTRLQGMLAGKKTKILGTGQWLQSLYYYDDRMRIIQSVSNNHLSGLNITSTRYDFAGKVIETRNEEQVILSGTTTSSFIYHTYNTYDHASRLLTTRQLIEGDTYNKKITIDSLKYNELGQLIEKNLHGKLQSIDYTYNIRGWLQSINNPDNLSSDGTGDFKPDLFAMKLLYNDTIGKLSQVDEKQYNGNIAGVKWRLDGDAMLRGYAYRYDGLNRLLRANYGESTLWSTNKYDVTGRNSDSYIQYDKNGNIISMGCRDGAGNFLDNLHYRYDGNRLMALGKGTDAPATDTYKYYSSGNLQRDEFKGCNIYYNDLDLPTRVWFGNNNYIDYLYDANGIKLREQTYAAGSLKTSTDYVGSVLYKDGSFYCLLTGDGRVTKTTGNYVYEYFLKDHLGNTRVSFTANSPTSYTVVQRADYYPFGQRFAGYSNNDNKLLYNGKELNAGIDSNNDGVVDFVLGYYDYDKRMYDPQLGRFTCSDPLADKFVWVSPYNYAENSPIANLDLWGLQAWNVTREWEFRDKIAYRAYAKEFMANALENGTKFTCSGLPLTIYISYAQKNGLPLDLVSRNGNNFVHFNAQDTKYKPGELNRYLNDVLTGPGKLRAKDIPYNSIKVPESQVQEGDMKVLKIDGSNDDYHTVVSSIVDDNRIDNNRIAYGNFVTHYDPLTGQKTYLGKEIFQQVDNSRLGWSGYTSLSGLDYYRFANLDQKPDILEPIEPIGIKPLEVSCDPPVLNQ